MTLSARDQKLLAIAAVACGVLYFRAQHYMPFFADDSFISLRYVQRFLAGHGLTWNDGEHVEGYSNLLWILLVAGLGRFGVELVLAARILGMILMSGALIAFVAAFRRSTVHPAAVAFVAIGMAATNTVAVWAIGGLEQPLLAFLLAAALALLLPWTDEPLPPRNLWIASALLGLLVLTRPDGALLSGMIAIALWVPRRDRTGTRQTVRLLVLPAVAYLGQLAFRLLYYGDWVPNTARAKLGFSPKHTALGLEYFEQSATTLAPFLVALVLVLWLYRSGSARRRQALLVLPSMAWLAYNIASGGDIFPAHRQYLPVLILGGFCTVELLDFIFTRPGILADNLLIVGAAWLGCVAYLQSIDLQGQRAVEERWEWDGETVGLFLKNAFGKLSPLLAIDAAGSTPYYSELPTLDMLGLNDPWLATHSHEHIGRGVPGHELGSGAYTLSRRPDIYLSHIPPGMDYFLFRGDKELDASPEFHRDYRFLYFQLPGPPPEIAKLWFRWDSPLVGVHVEPNRVVVPGLFLARGHQTLASVDSSGAVSTELRDGRSARLTGLSLTKGHWTATADATAPVEITLAEPGNATVAVTGAGTTLDLPADAPDLEIRIHATQGDARVRSITFTRTP